MGTRIDETGNRYGRLLVLEYACTVRKKAVWKCKCDCGNEVLVIGQDMRTGHTNSCGCLQKDFVVKKNRKYGIDYPTRLYHSWHSMIARCENPRTNYYCNYGGRGISVCEEWHDFETFAEWALNNGYSDNLTIDRIDNDGGYSPQNCRWATKIEQENNKRTNRKVTINGITKNLVAWCNSYGINEITVFSRLRYGWDIEKAITTPVPPKKRLVCVETGERFSSTNEAGKRYGVSGATIGMAAAGRTKTSCGLHWKYETI